MIKLLRERRSIRSYKNKSIERESLDLLVETLLRSPSSRNINPWEFIVVDDPDLLAGLSAAKD
jgi:nitroreductase